MPATGLSRHFYATSQQAPSMAYYDTLKASKCIALRHQQLSPHFHITGELSYIINNILPLLFSYAIAARRLLRCKRFSPRIDCRHAADMNADAMSNSAMAALAPSGRLACAPKRFHRSAIIPL